jgi:hypothetical protein
LNLVVKIIPCQFDVPKAKGGQALDVASQVLADLAGNIEMEEMEMDQDGDEEEADDQEEGWFDPQDGMSQEEQEVLDLSVHPVQLVLVKVSLNSDRIWPATHSM